MLAINIVPPDSSSVFIPLCVCVCVCVCVYVHAQLS